MKCLKQNNENFPERTGGTETAFANICVLHSHWLCICLHSSNKNILLWCRFVGCQMSSRSMDSLTQSGTTSLASRLTRWLIFSTSRLISIPPGQRQIDRFDRLIDSMINEQVDGQTDNRSIDGNKYSSKDRLYSDIGSWNKQA